MAQPQHYPQPPLDKVAQGLRGWLDEYSITHCGVYFEELDVQHQTAVFNRVRDYMGGRVRAVDRDPVEDSRRESRRPSRSTKVRECD